LLIPWLLDLPPVHGLATNPIYMAGWVGMLITGLNMLPVSQLDGGHVAYAVLGRYARWVGRLLLLVAWSFVIYTYIRTDSATWALMLVIIAVIGIDHPPTADDTVRIGPLRWILGLVSLAIPIFCFTPVPLGIMR
jgi:membrane-associated protease RseP (regulator of RpoE activity)